MNKTKFSAKKWLLLGCSLVFLLAGSSRAQPSAGSPGFIYLVGSYGYLQKMDMTLNVLTTTQIHSLARSVRIAAADISPDGKRLFLAVSRKENPLVIIETTDLSVIPDVNINFPNPVNPWTGHVPFDIIAVAPTTLYWSDECYSSTSPGDSFNTLLVNLNERTAKPVRNWSFENKNEIEISPDRERMAVYHGGRLLIVRASTGEILKTVGREVIDQKTVVSFKMDWSRNVLECCAVPWATGDSPEKLRIDMNSGQVTTRESVKNADGSRFAGLQTNRQRATSGRTYVLDHDGSIEALDNTKCEVLKKLNSVVSGVTPGSNLALYVQPSGNLIFAQKDAVQTLPNGKGKDVSSLCAVDAETGQVAKTMDYPERIVAVLFGK